MCRWKDCVVDATGAEWSRVVIADGTRYRICCGGLIGAALACEVLSEGQSGICVEFDVAGAAAVALLGSPAACGRSGRVLIVGYFVAVLVSIIKKAWTLCMSVCRVRVCRGGVFVRNCILYSAMRV